MTDADLFEAFVRQYQDMVFATALRLVGGHPEAEDIAQTTFLKAFERFDSLASSPTAGGWLKTVATNLALNHLSRYRSRWRFFSEVDASREDEAEGFASTLPARDSSDAALDQAERHALLERGLRALPPQQRVPLVLYHFDELSYEAIAARLGVSLAKVKTDIHRGRLALRRLLEDDDRPR